MIKKIVQFLFLLFLLNTSIHYFRDGFWTQDFGYQLFRGAILIIHEAGHAILSITGSHQIIVLGGTLLQLIVPLVFIFYFIWKGHKYSSAIMLWWLGLSVSDMGVYMADAKLRALPLISGGVDGHDWNNLFGLWGLMKHSDSIGLFAIRLGYFIMSAAMLWALWIIISDTKIAKLKKLTYSGEPRIIKQ
ncbi:hypothetical protein C0584_03085 [Candidatus Parcubacteria bacterium]|nr:MAG: hypothetical protein C0584_03085 [Candidatus Parcubacteria bacterium]